MDVDLATPDLVSVDTLLAVVAIGLAGYGGVQVLTGVGTEAGTTGWVLLAIGWVILFPRLFLKLNLGADAVEVGVLTGTRRVPYTDVTGARVVDGRLGVRWFGVGTSGYHTGRYHLTGEGQVTAYASRLAGPFVLLDRGDERPVLVSPNDPDAFLDALATRTAAVR